jgi:hypothetical protein
MQTTNQSNTFTRRVDRKEVVDNRNVKTDRNRTVNVATDSKTLADGTVVTTTKTTTTKTVGEQKINQEQAKQLQDIQTSAVNSGEIRKSSHSQIHQTNQHIENRHAVKNVHNQVSTSDTRNISNISNQQHVVNQQHVNQQHVNQQHVNQQHVINQQHVVNKQHVEKHVTQATHHRKNVMTSSEEISNQILHRKGLHTSTEALHATSSAALDMRKSICNLHDQGHISQNSDRRSLSSIHRSTQENNMVNRRGQQSSTTYQVVERPQKIVRKDNLSVGGHFYGQSEARSYGEFTKQQNVQRVERVTRRSNISNISLGDTSSTVVTSYKKEYLPRNVGPCPAVLIDIPKGPFKHTRDTKSHKFYAPVSNK